MATTEELEKEILAEMAADPVAYAAGPVNDVITIDGETRVISVPASELLFGVETDKDVERKHFRCPRVVGDGIDLSKHQIYISYITSDSTGKSFSGDSNLYLCEDVAVDDDDITFSWQLSGNVFASAGFISFKVLAAKTDGENVQTRWNTVPAVGTVLMTVPDGMDISETYPDIVTQLLERMESVEKIATEEAMQGYVNTYLEAHPAEIDETLTDPKKAAPASVVGELKKDIVECVFSKTKNVNLLDIDDSDVKHGFYNSTNGEYTANGGALTSGFIPYESDSVYRFTFPTAWFNYSVTLWDEKKSIVLADLSSFISKENGYATFSSTTYSNAKYVRFTIFDQSKDFSAAMVVKDVEYPSTYIPYGYTVKYSKKLDREIENIAKNINPVTIFDNKVMLFTGDSICYGANWRPTVEDYSNTGWRKIIQEKYPKSITYGYGIGGTTISKRSGRTDSILERMTKMFSEHPEADYIIIEGGVNDAYNITDCPIGTISTGYSDELNENTFAGALESIFKYAQTHWIGKKIGYIVTFKVPSAMGQFKFNEYMDIAKQICEKWSVPYCDLYNESNLNYFIQEVSDAYGGGLHPNEAGYIIITNKIEKWMETL